MLLINVFSYGQRKDYYSEHTIIGDKESNSSQIIDEKVVICINENQSFINLNFIGQDLIMTLYYSSSRIIDGYKFYYVDRNIWSIHAVALKDNGNGSSLTFLYPSPSTTVWIFSPLKKL
jgi:hypothetical protein